DLESIANLKIDNLFQRLKKQPNITEVVLALNPDIPGETTAMYLERELKKNILTIKITRLARGLPMGSDLQYADEITLSSAFKHRY
ncbi:MAG: toprim domain-containing protein, partial [bacterium]|nr:toprim domain-containing protein [bacterium]